MEAVKEKIIDRNYGSIPHLSISKFTKQADKKIEPGQESILTEKTRDYRDLIIVTEKVDGSNVGVIRLSGGCGVIPVTRAGYNCADSPYRQHHLFIDWVFENIHMFQWLPYQWRVVGEWCLQAHGTMYDITDFSPFVAFDIFDNRNQRLPYLMFSKLCYKHGIETVPLLHIGQPVKIKTMIKEMGKGHYGDPAEGPEGFVYRCERLVKVDFLAKYVRADKQDGKYLESKGATEGVWNKGAEYHVKGLR